MCEFCGTPCIMAHTPYGWRRMIFYIPLVLCFYFLYTWVAVFTEDYLLPCLRRCKSLNQFLQGAAPTLAFRLALGTGTGYENRWHGPESANPYSRGQLDDVRFDRDIHGKPYDLIVTQNFWGGRFARLRGGKQMKQGKFNQHGGFFRFDQVVDANSKALAKQIKDLGHRIHCCSSRTCSDKSNNSGILVKAWSVIPRDV